MHALNLNGELLKQLEVSTTIFSYSETHNWRKHDSFVFRSQSPMPQPLEFPHRVFPRTMVKRHYASPRVFSHICGSLFVSRLDFFLKLEVVKWSSYPKKKTRDRVDGARHTRISYNFLLHSPPTQMKQPNCWQTAEPVPAEKSSSH